MRAIWSGSIGFGLVNIPVRIFSATQDSSLDLTMLDKNDHSNIKYKRVNSETGEEVAWGDIVKGYKIEGKYVVLTDEDYEKASPKKSKMIEIEEFVEETMIDTTFYETPYYLEPAKGGEKAYALLREALKESGKVAVGTYVMRTKENLCLLKGQGDMILLLRIRFAEEIRDYSELNIPAESASIKPGELKMAIALINQLTPKKFNIAKYKDTYDEELLKLIKMKAKGKDLPEPKFKLVHSKSKDLMAQLKESLDTHTSGHSRKKSILMSLEKYNKKRRFDDTPEPSGKKAKTKGTLIFVVQRHDASHLHYDFRLEAEGVLKSWAVPKGPSLNPADRRLAVMVEDHPVPYAKFEGDIPAGNYGAGHVDIWDNGTYEPIDEDGNAVTEKDFLEHLEKGSIKFRMHGRKLKGSFALVKMHGRGENNWLLLKHRDEFATEELYTSEDYAKKSSVRASRTTKTATKKVPVKKAVTAKSAAPAKKAVKKK